MIVFEHVLNMEGNDHFKTDVMRISRVFYYEFKKQGYNTHFGTKKAMICKLKYEELILKCECKFDREGHRMETCRKCITGLNIDRHEKEMIRKFGKDITTDCNCCWSQKIKEKIRIKNQMELINNQGAREYGTLINQLMNNQLGYELWTKTDLIRNIEYHKTTKQHGRNCKNCNIIKDRLNEQRSKEYKRRNFST